MKLKSYKLNSLSKLSLSRRLQRFKRSPKLFIPIPQRWIVVPYKPLSALVILILVACSIYLVLRSDIFLLRHLEFNKQNEPTESVLSNENLKQFLDSYVTRSMFLLNKSQLTQDLKQEFLALADVKMFKKLPDKLIIKWSEHEPAAVINWQNVNFLVSADGLVYSKIDQAGDLPIIYGLSNSKMEVGDMLEGGQLKDILAAIYFFSCEEKLAIQQVSLEENNVLEIFSSSGWKVIFSLEGEMESQLETLEAIVTEYQTRAEAFSEIDLRFRFPVVR
ncbi:cell division protein FtsQ/DivIB [Patescibacteria group bacterium]|nr:cell division protein FtsQ/DivIB [Patescibacteria group bacterium]